MSIIYMIVTFSMCVWAISVCENVQLGRYWPVPIKRKSRVLTKKLLLWSFFQERHSTGNWKNDSSNQCTVDGSERW